MKDKASTTHVVMGAIILVVVAAFSGWSLHSHLRGSNASPAAVTVEDEASGVPVTPVATDLPQPSRPTSLPIFRQDPRGFAAANNANISKLVDAGRKKLRSRYDSEPVDGVWASRKQKALEAASSAPQIDQLDAKPLSFDSHCRSSVCLIGADFPSVDAADDWFTLYTMLAGPEMSNAAVSRSTNPDGTIHLQIYGLARK
ncbi:MAG: hypothetical protein JWL98_1346 [Xanthomonadaceae bacterium]|nr:hypothetical protein [Xanthomonadaceae bacterium]